MSFSFLFALFLFLTLSFIVTAFGSFLLRQFRISLNPSFFFLIAFFLGYSFLMLFLSLLGLFSLYSLFSLVSLLCFFSLLSVRDFSSLCTYLFSLFTSFRFPCFRWNHTLFLWFFLGIFFFFNTILTFFPFSEWDALAYHLPLAQWYASTHSLAPPPFLFHAQFPQLVEVLFSVGFLFSFSVGTFFTSFILLFFHTLFFLLLYLFARQYYGSATALYTLVILYTLPEISIFITNPYIDIITAAYQFLAFFFVFLIFFEKHATNTVSSLVVLAFLFSGVVAGIKYTGLFVVFFTLLALLFYFFFLNRKTRLLSVVFLLFLGLFLSSLFFSPFYLKNYYYMNNPVWPFLPSLFTDSVGLNKELILAWNDYFVNITFDKSNPLTFFLLPFYMTFIPSYFGSVYGIGVIFLLFCPLALYFMASKKYSFTSPVITHFLFYIITFVFLLFIWYKTQHSYRLLFFGFFLLALLAAQTILHLVTRFSSSFFRSFVLGLFFLLLLSNLAAYFVIYRAAVPVLLFQEPLSYYKEQRVSVAPVDNYINSYLPSDAVVLLVNDLRGYYIQRTYAWGEPMNNMLYIDYQALDSADALYAVLQEKNVTHIRINLFPQYNYTYGFYDKYYGAHITSLYSDLFASHATLLYEENHVQLYRLNYVLG